MDRARAKKMGRNKENAELPRDIIYTHILRRLPVKSLTRLRCVSKYWNQLTRDPSLSLLRKSLQSSPTHILITSRSVVGYESEIHFVSVPLRKDANLGTPVHLLSLPIDKHYILQSFDGLCIHHSNRLYPYHGDKPVYIFNPSTREIATVPVNDTLSTRSSHVSYYFGLSQLTGEYKVLGLRGCFTVDFEPISVQREVYTIGYGLWKHVKPALPFDPHELTYYTDPVCYNGALHWMRQS